MSSRFVPVSMSAALFNELMIRAGSGLALAIIALVCTYLGGVYFTLLILAACAVLSWEWWRFGLRGSSIFGDSSSVVSPFFVDIFVVLLSIGLFAGGAVWLSVVALAVGCGLAMAVRFVCDEPIWRGLGPVYICLPAAALIWVRQDEPFGLLAVIYLFVIVWATDSFAFFAGRGIGGPKLWPEVSPKKTWAGFVGGAVAGAIAGGAFSYLFGLGNVIVLCLLGVLLAIGAVAGDLLESRIKRTFRKKDASHLIPGHGGLFDRVDGLMMTAVFAALIALVRDSSMPASSLLIWG